MSDFLMSPMAIMSIQGLCAFGIVICTYLYPIVSNQSAAKRVHELVTSEILYNSDLLDDLLKKMGTNVINVTLDSNLDSYVWNSVHSTGQATHLNYNEFKGLLSLYRNIEVLKINVENWKKMAQLGQINAKSKAKLIEDLKEMKTQIDNHRRKFL